MPLLENLKGKKIILASKSPRRQELLKGLEVDFEIRTKEVEEVYSDDLKREAIPRFLSELKANAFAADLSPDELLITSDTIVYMDEKVLGKPKDREQAIEMVTQLSGNKHTVITAVTLLLNSNYSTFHDETEVTFVELDQNEIEHYIDHYKPYDKAGSYGVQELIGYIGIDKLEGSFYNVMGLPLHKLYAELKKI